MYRLPFNPQCSSCELGIGKGIAGQSEVPLSSVLLIVVSAYPGSRELQQGITLADNPNRVGPPDSTKAVVGAGEFLRYCLTTIVDPLLPASLRPITKYTYFTNAIKCSPQRGPEKLTVLPKHLNCCRDQWLTSELAYFSPLIPIFACSSEAAKALLGSGIYENRNRVNHYLDHPVIVSSNPVEWERYVTKQVPSMDTAREEVAKIIRAGVLTKYQRSMDRVLGITRGRSLPGSPLWLIKQDLQLLTNQIIKYQETRDV